MNDEGALSRRPRPNYFPAAAPEISTGGRAAPRLILEIPLEGRGLLYIAAESHEDELRLRQWLRTALVRREPLSLAIYEWLDDLDKREAA